MRPKISHPCRLVCNQFWDAPLSNGAIVEQQDLPTATLHNAEKLASNKQLVTQMLEYLNGHQGIQFTDNQTYYDAQTDKHTLSDILAEKNIATIDEIQIEDDFAQRNDFSYEWTWPVFPKDLDTSNILNQAQGLLWTRKEL
ncbi:MAG: hypothetical protein HRU15_16240 [Planctomycetes bacterium]|nr:hypothetical protein [Planctomycetota bacterium]